MKINKIYIHAFGGLKDFTLDLDKGLNVIYGNNEDGKSTVSAFIKAMFYGTGRSSKNLSESIRQKYTPWTGDTMAGRIYFENDGKKYCLEREFRKSDSTDRIELTDLDSGKVLSSGENVGNQFFGMSVSAFERSLFIANGDFIKDDTAAGEINAKLSNIAVTGAEDVSYKKIEKNILTARTKLISKNQKSGSYNEDLAQLKELEERLVNADRDAKLKQRLHDEGATRLREIETLTKKQAELKTKLNLKQDFENREKLTEFLNTKAQLDRINQALNLSDGTVINEAFVQKIDFCIGKKQKCEEHCAQINDEIKKLKQTIEIQNGSTPENAQEQIENLNKNIETLYAQKEQAQANENKAKTTVDVLNQKLIAAQNKKAAVNPMLLTLTAVSASIGAALAFVYLPVTIALCAIAAVLLCLSFIIRPQNKNAVAAVQNELASANNAVAMANADKNRLQEEINNINAKINILSSALNADAAVKAQYIANLNEKEIALNAEKEKLDAANCELSNLISGIDVATDAAEICRQLKQKTEQQKALKLQLKTASQYLGNIDYDDAREKLKKINQGIDFENIDFDAIDAEYQTLTDKISQLKEQATAIVTELKTSFRNSENPEELRRSIAELQEKANSKKDFCDSADIAVAVLEESFYELRRGYGSELEKLTHSLFAELTDGRYKNVSVSDTLDMSVEKSDVFGTRELGYLSLGTTHQAYLSLRLAIATLISGENTLPIFLDDALSQYDDTRTQKAIEYLKDFCADSQGVLFTCHSSICDIAKQHNISVQNPYGEK
ncbi:MAG: AAA family ATPase [Clostridia bacterium]|nr:AAA family ATPase [Clostridia bacterium]